MTTKIKPSVLADTAVVAGTYGGASQHASFVVDQQGRITNASNNTPSIATSQLTGTIAATQLANTVTYGINITGNSGTVAGLGVASGRNNNANQIVRTDGNGYLQTGYINSSNGNEKNNSNPSYVWGTNGTDDYMRTYNTAYLSVSYASTVGITYSNRSNSTYQILWGSGNSVYGTDLMYVNPYNGNFYTYGDVTAFVSDMRLKNVTGTITNALSKVNQLNGFTYTLNDLAAGFGYDTTSSKVGVSAQKVLEILPEAVSLAAFDIGEDGQSKSGENYLTVSYDKLVPLLIEAIKELNSKVDELTTKLNT